MAEQHETWDPTRTRKVENLDDMQELVFDALSEHIARMSCACENCDPSPHEDSSLSTSGGNIYVEVDGATYRISVRED